MTRLIHCAKLHKQAEGFLEPPLPGELGDTIYAQISKEAWQMWVKQQTMLINEYRLSLIDPQSKAFLLQEMQNFLFGTGSTKPPGYTDKHSHP